MKQGLKSPVDFRKISLQQVASNILGLYPIELKPKITYNYQDRTIKEKYVCISEFTNHNAKNWNNKFGWQNLVNWLNSEGYKVVSISEKPTKLRKVIDHSGKFPIENRINELKHCEFFITVSTGLAWIAWALNKKVVMISGVTEPSNEFKEDNIRIFNNKVCNGCWHKNNINLSEKDWCPNHKNTKRQFECTTSITSNMVIEKINKLNAKSI